MLARAIEQAFRDIRLPEHESTALPDPAPAKGQQIIVTDLGAMAFSTGTAWVRADTGATI